MSLDLTAAQRAEALAFAEGHSKLQIFLDSREADPTISIKECFPPQLSEERALKALYLLSRLHDEAAQAAASVDQLAVFKIRDGAALFPCFNNASEADLGEARVIADYLLLPRSLVDHHSAQLAMLALAVDTSEGLAERLLAEPTLEPFVEAGFDYITAFTKPLSETGEYDCDLSWYGHLKSARLPLIRGLVGDTFDKDAHDFEKGMQCCGRLFAGRDLPYSRLPTHTDLGGTATETCPKRYEEHYLPVAVIAAALGRIEALKGMEQKLCWRVRGNAPLYAAAFKVQEATLLFLLAVQRPELALLRGAARAGMAGFPLIRDRPALWLTDCSPLWGEVVKSLSFAEGDVRPFVDFIASRGHHLNQFELARLGCLDLLQELVAAEGGQIQPLVLEDALCHGHSAVADWCLANGARFLATDEWGACDDSGLAQVCIGFKGDVAALQYWHHSKGAPASADDLIHVGRMAAFYGSIPALSFIETLPAFDGWSGALFFNVARGAALGRRSELLRWVASRPSFLEEADEEHPIPPSSRYLKAVADEIVEDGDLEVIKACTESFGFSFSEYLFDVVKRGPSHRHIVDYLASRLKEDGAPAKEDWHGVAEDFTAEMAPGLQSLIDAGLELSSVFGPEAAACGNLAALEFAWANGALDNEEIAQEAFFADQAPVLEWLMRKDRNGLAALSLEELLDLTDKDCKAVLRWVRWYGPWKTPSQVGQKRARSASTSKSKPKSKSKSKVAKQPATKQPSAKRPKVEPEEAKAKAGKAAPKAARKAQKVKQVKQANSVKVKGKAKVKGTAVAAAKLKSSVKGGSAGGLKKRK